MLSNKEAGNRPENLLSSRLTSERGLVEENKSDGIVPTRLFELKYSWVSRLAYIKLEGIDPVNLLLFNKSTSNERKLANEN